MKQHSVPQEIMSVEFNLFGSMNIRQFGYIAAAGGLGYFMFLILPGVLKWVGAGVSILFGLALAFAPGFDGMLTNFILTLKRPTRRVWKKEPTPPDFMLDIPIKSYRTGHIDVYSGIDTGQKGARVFNQSKAKEELLEENFVDIVDKELEQLQQSLGKKENIDSELEIKLSKGLTDIPNLINGQVFDAEGNPVSAGIVLVRDSAKKSVLVVQTNSKGIFLSSKALPIGKYTLNYVVDNVIVVTEKVVVNGAVLPFIKLQAN